MYGPCQILAGRDPRSRYKSLIMGPSVGIEAEIARSINPMVVPLVMLILPVTVLFGIFPGVMVLQLGL